MPKPYMAASTLPPPIRSASALAGQSGAPPGRKKPPRGHPRRWGGRQEQGLRLGDRLHLGPGVEGREVRAAGPGPEEVAVVWAFRITRLTRRVGSQRAVPVGHVGNQPERGAAGLVVAVRRVVDGVRV